MFIKYSLLFILKYNNKQYIIPYYNYFIKMCKKWLNILFIFGLCVSACTTALNDKVLVG